MEIERIYIKYGCLIFDPLSRKIHLDVIKPTGTFKIAFNPCAT